MSGHRAPGRPGAMLFSRSSACGCVLRKTRRARYRTGRGERDSLCAPFPSPPPRHSLRHLATTHLADSDGGLVRGTATAGAQEAARDRPAEKAAEGHEDASRGRWRPDKSILTSLAADPADVIKPVRIFADLLDLISPKLPTNIEKMPGTSRTKILYRA